MKAQAVLPFKPCTFSWAALLLLTTTSFALGSGASGRRLMAAVLALTLIKGHLVVSHFMGLRRVRLRWRIAMAAYLAAVGGVIALAYSIT